MRKGMFAAFVAAMLIGILFGGCGGGGGGTKPPVDQPTVISGKVENESNQAVSRAKVYCEGLTTETNSAGAFTINPIGQGIKTLTISKDGYDALQLPVDLNQTKVDIQGPLRLLIPTRETMDEVAAPANWPVYFTKKFGTKELLPNFLRFTPEGGVELKLYVAGTGDLPENNGRPYAWAHLEGRYAVDLFFYDVVYGGSPTNLVLTGTVVFVIPTDNIKPTVTLEGIDATVKGNLMIKGTAKDLDEQGRTKVTPYVVDLDNPSKSKGLTRDYAGYHIEGPPSGVKSVTLNYNGQDHSITLDNSGSFTVAVDTTTIPDGAITFKVSAVDNAGLTSEVKSLTTTIDNVPDPPSTDPFVTMDTTPSKLVMVNETARSFDSSVWPDLVPGLYVFGNLAVDLQDRLLVYLQGTGAVISLPRQGASAVWPSTAGNNGKATFSPQGNLYVSDITNDLWRFDSTGRIDRHVTINGPGAIQLIKADNNGYIWAYCWNNGLPHGYFLCYNPDLTQVMVDKGSGPVPLWVDVDAIDMRGFAADTTLDSLVYYDSVLDPKDGLWKGRIIRRRISTGEDFILQAYPEVFGCDGIEIDSKHGQVIAEISFGPQYYLAQFGKKTNGQWGELYLTDLSIPADQLIRGAKPGEFYTSHSDWKTRKWSY